VLDSDGLPGDEHRQDLDRRRIVGLRRKDLDDGTKGFRGKVPAWGNANGKVKWPRPYQQQQDTNAKDSVYLSLASNPTKPTSTSDNPKDNYWLDGDLNPNLLRAEDLL
jgi:hypothetical protein